MKVYPAGAKPPPKRPTGAGLTVWLTRAGFFGVGVVVFAGLLHFGDKGLMQVLFVGVVGVSLIYVVSAIFRGDGESEVETFDDSEEAAPMDVQRLVDAGGRWRGTNRLHDPHTNGPEDAPSTLTVHPMPGGQIVRIEQEWSYQGTPQEGHLLIIAGAYPGHARAHWVDTWHQSTTLMILEQDEKVTDRFSFFGRYPAPPGPDWGWRIELQHASPGTLTLSMINISPERKSTPAVEATYQRESPRSD